LYLSDPNEQIMRIIIAGAGDMGYHLAALLSKENQDIILIDSDHSALMKASSNIDLMTIEGDATSSSILLQAEISKSDLYIAVTSSEKTNLLSAILAKQLGVKNTIARISNTENLELENRDRYRNLGVDMLISPDKLAAMEIKRLLEGTAFTDLFEFEGGKLCIIGFKVDKDCPLINRSIADCGKTEKKFKHRVIAVLRGQTAFIPKADTVLLEDDHVYASTQKKYLENATHIVGKLEKVTRKIMILGGSDLSLRTAQELEDKYIITVIISDEDRAKLFVEKLNNTLVIHADPDDIDTLKDEDLIHMDAALSLTPNSETNIVISLIAEELGVYKTIALVENVNYTYVSQRIGIDTIINKKIIAANNIFKFVRKGIVKDIASLHGVDSEIIEFEIAKNSRLVRKKIADLEIPEKAIIAGIIRGSESFTPSGDDHLMIDDRIVILALSEAIPKVEEIFK